MALDKKILSIDFDDDDKNYLAFSEYLEKDTKRKMNQSASDIEKMGKQYLKEIERKKKNQDLIKTKLIPYILKHCNKYDKEELNSYSFEDIQSIYDELKIQNQSAIIKFFRFIFNI